MALTIVFDMLRYAAELISFVMGFTMSTVFDPNFGVQSTIISQFVIWVAILFFIAIGGDHIEIELIGKVLQGLPFGAFFNYHSVYEYFKDFMYKYFLIGFGLAFPILAISLMSDVIFGMIMKTMPQFNLLVIGFPIKISAAFMVMMVIIGSMMVIFKREIFDAFNSILGFF
jgi:flagellar biosynthetic protein FliR